MTGDNRGVIAPDTAATTFPGPVVEVDGVSVALAGREVLHDVTLEVRRGRVLVLRGASGAGKSTLLRCLNGLVWPDRGTVRLDGVDLRALPAPAVRRRVALVAQAPVMLTGTVRDNLTYGLDAPSPQTLADAATAAALPRELLERPADALSGGEQARVAIARALTRGPEVVLLDEPTSALDAGATAIIVATVRELADRGLAAVVSTHDDAVAAAVAGDVVTLRDGRVVL